MSTLERILWICAGTAITCLIAALLIGEVSIAIVTSAISLPAMATTMHFTVFRANRSR